MIVLKLLDRSPGNIAETEVCEELLGMLVGSLKINIEDEVVN